MLQRVLHLDVPIEVGEVLGKVEERGQIYKNCYGCRTKIGF